MFLSLIPSRAARSLFAVSKSVASNNAQYVRTRYSISQITNVIRPSPDSRANSIGNNGPSSNHLTRIGKSRGSHIREPQPRQAILSVVFRGITILRVISTLFVASRHNFLVFSVSCQVSCDTCPTNQSRSGPKSRQTRSNELYENPLRRDLSSARLLQLLPQEPINRAAACWSEPRL